MGGLIEASNCSSDAEFDAFIQPENQLPQSLDFLMDPTE
jgi:hypothetical protein